jgi:hypothetical protein
MKTKIKILCYSLSVGLFLLFGFSNPALAYPDPMRTGCDNPLVFEYSTVNLVFCNSTPFITDNRFLKSSSLVSYYSCDNAGSGGGHGLYYCTTHNNWTAENVDYSINPMFDFDDMGSYTTITYNNIDYNKAAFLEFLAPQSTTTGTSTPALGVLDTIGTSIFSTIIYFLTIFFTQLWPIILVIAICTAFVSALTYYILKIINQR